MTKMTKEQALERMQEAKCFIQTTSMTGDLMRKHLEGEYGASFSTESHPNGNITSILLLGLSATAWCGGEMAARNWAVRVENIHG